MSAINEAKKKITSPQAQTSLFWWWATQDEQPETLIWAISGETERLRTGYYIAEYPLSCLRKAETTTLCKVKGENVYLTPYHPQVGTAQRIVIYQKFDACKALEALKEYCRNKTDQDSALYKLVFRTVWADMEGDTNTDAWMKAFKRLNDMFINELVEVPT